MTECLSRQENVLAGEEEDQLGPLLVRQLEQHGIAATDCKKLQEVILAFWFVQ